MVVDRLLLQLISEFPLTVKTEHCINQDNLKTCERCKNICPTGAIEFENNRPKVNFDKCTVCGLCFSECPVNVFQIKFNWEKLYKEKETLTVGCFLTDQTADVKVPCLAMLNEEILASLILWGYKRVNLLTDKCKECPQKENYEFIKKYIERAKLLLHYHRVEGEITENTAEITNEEEGLDRREFLSALFGEEEKRKPPKVNEKINVPLWRQLFFETVKRYPPEDICYQAVEEPSLRFAKPVINPNTCQRNNMCSFWCPTRALTSDESGIYFTQILCTDCGLCEKICPTSAITLQKTFVPRRNVMAGKVVIGKGEKKICKGCGKEFVAAPGQEYCLYCRKDKEINQLIRKFLGI